MRTSLLVAELSLARLVVKMVAGRLIDQSKKMTGEG
jgi:hypothetical protein